AAAQKDINDARASFDDMRMLQGVQQMQTRNQERFSASATKASNERKAGLSAEAKELARLTDATNDYLKSLQDENARYGKNAIELKQMEVAAKAAEAAKAGLIQQSLDIIRAGDQAVGNMRKEAQTRYTDQSQSIKDEIAILGLVGTARDKAALAL